MDRKEYLELCRQAAITRAGAKHRPLEHDMKVKFNGILYEPISYELGFTETGAVRHTAVLLDKNGNCTVRCNLANIERATV